MDLKHQEFKEIVVLDGKNIAKDKLQEQKEKVKQQKGMSIIEVSNGVYKTRIQG